jgi:hypothetical protein
MTKPDPDARLRLDLKCVVVADLSAYNHGLPLARTTLSFRNIC